MHTSLLSTALLKDWDLVTGLNVNDSYFFKLKKVYFIYIKEKNIINNQEIIPC